MTEHTIHHVHTDLAVPGTAVPPTTTHVHAGTNPLAGLTEGRIVHYVLPDGRNPGEYRPAIVVRDWHRPNGAVNLQCFTDGTNDYSSSNSASSGLLWATSVPYDENKGPHTWHWIEQV